jgi:hypothetical protein
MADTTRFDYRYPLTKLDKSDDYLKITVLDYKPPGFAATGFVLPTASEVAGYSIKMKKELSSYQFLKMYKIKIVQLGVDQK